MKGSLAMPRENDSAFLLHPHKRGLQNLHRMAHYRDTMKDMTNRRLTSALMLLITVVVTTLNLYLLYDALTGLA